MGGQTVGEGLIIDFSMYMNKVINFNPEENWVEVEPGIILDELKKCLKLLEGIKNSSAIN